MTIQNAGDSAAAEVETDLPPGLGATVVRVAHIIARGNSPRGIDFRNPGRDPAFNGRVLRGIGEDNVVRDLAAGEGYGIRVVNAGGVTGATTWVTLRRNRSYGNKAGLFAVTMNSTGNVILIESRANRLTNNRVGCLLLAGNSDGDVADSNVLMFDSQSDVMTDNDGPGETVPFPGGISAAGGNTEVALPNRSSGNLLQLALVDTRFSGNHPGSDIRAFGAHGKDGVVLPGTDNHVDILLKGVSRQAALSIVDSDPPDPDGTNTVVVRR